MTFNDLEGQNHIAYDAIRPNMSIYMPNIRLTGAAVKPVKRHEHTNTQTHTQTDCNFIYIDIIYKNSDILLIWKN